MSYSTRTILRDYKKNPIPQYYNETLDSYEVNKGEDGQAFTILCDANGVPVTMAQLQSTLQSGSTSIINAINDLIGVMNSGI